MLIPIVNDIKADPILAQLLILLALPIIGFFALLLPIIPLFILYTLVKDYVQKNKTKRLHSSASKITYRRETLRRDINNQERKSQDRAYASGMDSSGRYQPRRGNRHR